MLLTLPFMMWRMHSLKSRLPGIGEVQRGACNAQDAYDFGPARVLDGLAALIK